MASTKGVALIVGCNGIVGFNLLKKLHDEEGDKWEKIYALSRKSEPQHDAPRSSKVHYIACDITDKQQCEQKIGQLPDVTDCFFLTWIPSAWSNLQKMVDDNKAAFDNVLYNVLDGQSKQKLRHWTLQTGTKHYGSHLGPFPSEKANGFVMQLPQVEHDDNPAASRHPLPDFYYVEEDTLRAEHKQRNAQWGFNVVRPHDILGRAPSSAMNLGICVAVYASIMKELGHDTLYFPGAEGCWTQKFDCSYAKLIAEFELWCSRTKTAWNQAFNCTNDDIYTWERVWPHICSLFGMKSGGVRTMKTEEEMPKHADTWKAMAKKYKLLEEDINKVATWWFLDAELGRNYSAYASMEKAKKYGWNKQLKTEDMWNMLVDEYVTTHYIPDPKAIKPTH